MAISIKDLKTRCANQAPRVLIYGPPGVGKTTLASEFPDPVFLQVEEGTPGDLELASFGALGDFDQVMEAIGSLYTEEHDRKTVVLDSLDKFEPHVWAKVCADNGWASIEAPGYGRGYVEADRVWREFFDGINALRRDRGMTIVLIAHSTITTFPNPAGAEYPRWDIRLHKRALGIVQDEVDAILLVNQEAALKQDDSGFGKKRTHAAGGSTRWIYCDGRPSWVAKNRYSMPEKVIYRKGEGYSELAPFFPTARNHQEAA
jgi:DNA polymerase III delta prime subunit